MNLKDFLRECNEREVFKRLSIYIVSSWIILQVLVAIYEPLGIPQKSVTFLILLLLIGFPFYIYFLWTSRIKHTLVGHIDEDFTDPRTAKKFKNMYFSSLIVISVLSVIASALIVNKNFISANIGLNFETSDKIAVLNFDNNTGDPEFDIVGKMTADWLIYGITENQAGEVISSDIINDRLKMMTTQVNIADSKVINQLFRSNKIIKGAFYLDGDELEIKCTVIDGRGGEFLMTFPSVRCASSDPLVCIEELRQEVVGYLFDIERGDESIEIDPPNFEAYEKNILARESYKKPELYLKYLNESIAADPNYFEPQILRVQHFYNLGKYRTADSLLTSLDSTTKVSMRQQKLLNFCKALLEGKNNRIYSNFKYEYDITPTHLETNSTAMVLIHQYLNKPEDVEPIFEVLDMSDLDIENCIHCHYRYFIQALAYNELDEFDKTIELLEPVIGDIEALYLKRTLSRAYLETGDQAKLETLLGILELGGKNEELSDLKYHLGLTHLNRNEPELARRYFEDVTNNTNSPARIVAQSHYYLKDYASAEIAIEELLKKEGNSVNLFGLLASTQFLSGKKEKSEESLKRLEDLRQDYQFGTVDYALAQYYAATGQNEEALKSLQRSIIQGNKYLPYNFQNDPHFVELKDSPVFHTIMTYWQQ